MKLQGFIVLKHSKQNTLSKPVSYLQDTKITLEQFSKWKVNNVKKLQPLFINIFLTCRSSAWIGWPRPERGLYWTT